ncbi:ATP-binding protein [Streptomyces sp. NPDC059096]|uniref:ATP-binding protein n=1 Tax=unclassified Streptomyces TaxID=2593676 RepID=UPI0036CE6C97
MPADPAHLAHARRIVESEMRLWGCPPAQIDAARLAVTEMAAPLCGGAVTQYDLGVQRATHCSGAVTIRVGVHGSQVSRDIPVNADATTTSLTPPGLSCSPVA